MQINHKKIIRFISLLISHSVGYKTFVPVVHIVVTVVPSLNTLIVEVPF